MFKQYTLCYVYFTTIKLKNEKKCKAINAAFYSFIEVLGTHFKEIYKISTYLKDANFVFNKY